MDIAVNKQSDGISDIDSRDGVYFQLWVNSLFDPTIYVKPDLNFYCEQAVSAAFWAQFYQTYTVLAVKVTADVEVNFTEPPTWWIDGAVVKGVIALHPLSWAQSSLESYTTQGVMTATGVKYKYVDWSRFAPRKSHRLSCFVRLKQIEGVSSAMFERTPKTDAGVVSNDISPYSGVFGLGIASRNSEPWAWTLPKAFNYVNCHAMRLENPGKAGNVLPELLWKIRIKYYVRLDDMRYTSVNELFKDDVDPTGRMGVQRKMTMKTKMAEASKPYEELLRAIDAEEEEGEMLGEEDSERSDDDSEEERKFKDEMEEFIHPDGMEEEVDV